MTTATQTITIKALADKCGKTPRILLDQLTAKYPETNWTVNSEVPHAFLESVKKNAAEYDSTETPANNGKQIGAGALTVQESATVIMSNPGYEYGVLLALEEVQLEIVAKQGRLAGLQLISAYQSAKSDVVDSFLKSEFDNSQKQLEDINKRAKALTSDAGKKQTTIQTSNSKLAQMRKRLAASQKF